MKSITSKNNLSGFAGDTEGVLTSRQLFIRLGVTFSLLIALLIVVGDMSLKQMDRINADLQSIVGKQWVKLRLSREAVSYSNRNSRLMMDILLIQNKQQIAALLEERKENSDKIAGMLVDLEKLCETDQERRLLSVVNDTRKLYIASYLEALHLLADGNQPEAAAAVMVREATPALLVYQTAWNEYIRYEGDQLEAAARESGIRSSAAHRYTLLLIVASVLIAGAISLFAVKHIIKEIISSLKAEKAALQDAHRGAEVFIDAVPSILIGLDHQARIVRWNSKAACVFGLAKADAIGVKLADCGIHWLKDGLQEEIQAWCEKNESQRCDLSYEMNGKTRLLGFSITPIDMDDKAFTTLLIGSDITDRKAFEEMLHQAQKLESVGQLAAGIAHEINTPTQYIGDNVRFLKDSFQDISILLGHYERLYDSAARDTLSTDALQVMADAVKRADPEYLLEEIPKAIEQTLEGVKRVSTLVSAMKEFSHPDTKEKVQLDLNHAISNTVTVARNEWKYVADLETEFDPSLPMVSCLPGEFNQVILNLIVNAAHAISDAIKKSGSEKGKIRIQTRNCAEYAEIRLQDSGTGIPEKARDRIFDPFFTTKEIGKGTGQGLSIARSVIVDKHGGTIHFETEEGKGTTFIVRLPFDGKTLVKQAVAA